MLAELIQFEQLRRSEMTESAVAGAASTLEDYVVILQKASKSDPAAVISLVDSRLVERLHSVLDHIIKASEDQENFQAACNAEAAEASMFLRNNIKSILSNISINKDD